MKRPAVLIVAVVAGALLVVGAGASAHTFTLVRELGTQAASSNDEASGVRGETPEPEESPEASPTAEPTERPEPAENENENENENEDNDDNDAGEAEHDGDHHGGDHDGGGDD